MTGQRGSSLDLLRRQVFLMSGNPPCMAKRILDSAQTIAIKLVSYGSLNLRAGRDRLAKYRICVLDIQMNTYGRSAQALRTARAYFRKFIRQHDHRITNLELGMTDSAVWLRYAHPFGGQESLFVELDCLRRSPYAEIRRY